MAIAVFATVNIQKNLNESYQNFGQVMSKILAIESVEITKDASKTQTFDILKTHSDSILKSNEDITFIEFRAEDGSFIYKAKNKDEDTSKRPSIAFSSPMTNIIDNTNVVEYLKKIADGITSIVHNTGSTNSKLDELKVIETNKTANNNNIAVVDNSTKQTNSPMYDIASNRRNTRNNRGYNAAKLIAELTNEIPQGVYKKDEFGVVTSINLGMIIGGGIETAIDNIKENNIKSNEYLDYVVKKAVTNVINTKAGATYSIRSSSREYEKNLITDIKLIVDNFNKKYDGLAIATMEVSEHLPPFEKSDDDTLIKVAEKASENLGYKVEISTFHAGAETHIYANNKNKFGVQFKPTLVGLANIYNMHSSNEQIDYKSYIKGYELLKEMFKVYNK